AIIYGDKKDSIPISLVLGDIKEILKTEKGENAVLRIHRDDIQVDAMLKELQYDYLSDNIIHADFLRIDLEKPVLASVPINVQGVAIGVRMEDGIFDFMTRELKVRSLPLKIPKEFTVDVTDLHAGSSIKVNDLDLGDDIELMIDSHTVVCAVSSKALEEVVEEEEGIEEGVEEEAPEADAAAAEETTKHMK
ncbi:MAG: 50S ribosomal protein L25, partial [bacterium]|nr:50S ribosomal protein L25 [bacterium]